jgi:dihydrofolate synthase/folylpolyglutamate synthase
MARTTKSSKKSSPTKEPKIAKVPVKSGPTVITNYATAIKWLYEHNDVERMRSVRYNTTTFNLERMRRLLKVLDNPQKHVQFVHIAGTKGKGSTVAMLSSMLVGSGYTVGAFTSPHMVDMRERITINERMIPHADFVDIMKLIQAQTEEFGTSQPTFFEILTAVAIKYFSDQAVDIVLLETGLGGRLDSTNVIKPLVCGVTQISLDHMNILGKELTEIAAEKAGIFKKNVPAFTVQQDPKVLKVLRSVAEEVGAPLHVIGDDIDFSYRFEVSRDLGPHTRVCLMTSRETYDHLPVPLQGEHQALNCGLALALLDKLCEHQFAASEENLIQGLSETTLAGRMELVRSEPRILLDGAHNAASIQSLIRAVGAHIPYDSMVMIFGCAEDKDVDGMLQQVNLGADKVIFTRARANPRAVEPAELMRRFGEMTGKMAQVAPRLPEALNLANLIWDTGFGK